MPPNEQPPLLTAPAAVASLGFSAPGSAAFSQVLLIGQASDGLHGTSSGTTLADMRASSGDSPLVGAGGANILIGGAGNDLLIGSSGRNLMIGGFGQATLIDGLDSDIPIGGQTNHDPNDGALTSIMNDWTSSDSWALRLADLTSTVFAVRSQDNLETTVLNQNLVFAGGGDLVLSILSPDDVIEVTA